MIIGDERKKKSCTKKLKLTVNFDNGNAHELAET